MLFPRCLFFPLLSVQTFALFYKKEGAVPLFTSVPMCRQASSEVQLRGNTELCITQNEVSKNKCCQAFGLEVPTHHNPILPSLRLGGHNNPNPYPLRLPRLSGESNVLRRGFNPPPIPRPLQGGGSTAPPRRSFIKVLLPKIGRREIPYATELRLFVFAPLTKFISNLKITTPLQRKRFRPSRARTLRAM